MHQKPLGEIFHNYIPLKDDEWFVKNEESSQFPHPILMSPFPFLPGKYFITLPYIYSVHHGTLFYFICKKENLFRTVFLFPFPFSAPFLFLHTFVSFQLFKNRNGKTENTYQVLISEPFSHFSLLKELFCV